MKFNAYVDGLNLYKGALQNRPELKWLDLHSFCEDRWPEHQLDKVYFFTSRVKEKFPGDDAPRRQHTYLRALEATGVQIVLGRFIKKIDWLRLVSHLHKETISPQLEDASKFIQNAFDDSSRTAFPDMMKSRIWKYGEKGTDVNLSSYLLRDIFRSDLKAALVISADSDFMTPIRIAIENDVVVKTIIPRRGADSVEIRGTSSIANEMKVKWLRDNQFPSEIRNQKGITIQRPQEW